MSFRPRRLRIREPRKAVRRLRGIVQNVFAGKAAKRAEWKSASHVEPLPETNGDGETPPPNPQT